MEQDKLIDLNKREWLMLVPLSLLALTFGIFPNLLLDLINDSVNLFVEFVSAGNISQASVK